jgi:hypothetical protein
MARYVLNPNSSDFGSADGLQKGATRGWGLIVMHLLHQTARKTPPAFTARLRE